MTHRAAQISSWTTYVSRMATCVSYPFEVSSLRIVHLKYPLGLESARTTMTSEERSRGKWIDKTEQILRGIIWPGFRIEEIPTSTPIHYKSSHWNCPFGSVYPTLAELLVAIGSSDDYSLTPSEESGKLSQICHEYLLTDHRAINDKSQPCFFSIA